MSNHWLSVVFCLCMLTAQEVFWTASIYLLRYFIKLSWHYLTEILSISAKSVWHTKPYSSQQKYKISFNFCVILKILGVAASRIFNFCILVSVLTLFLLLAFSIRPQAIKIRKNKESGEPLSLLWSIYNSIRY